MAVIGYPQRLTTLLTTLFQRGQRLLMRRFHARGSSSQIPSPAVLVYLLLLSGDTCCQVYFAIQQEDDRADHTGQRLGSYCSSRLMGVGGSARVYLGEHIHVDFETLFSQIAK